MLKKLNFVNLRRKQNKVIYFFNEVLPRYFLSKPLIFENKHLLSRKNLRGGNTNDGQNKIQEYFYVAFNSVL